MTQSWRTNNKDPQTQAPQTTYEQCDKSILQVVTKTKAETERLVKQQQQSQLPRKDVPVFKGDP